MPTDLSLPHRLWQRLPERPRRALLARGAALLAARPAGVAPPMTGGAVVLAGEFARASGLGQGARLMQRALVARGRRVATVPLGLQAERLAASGLPGAAFDGAPIVLHVNSPVLPAALLRAPRVLLRGRRVIGYWAWELPTVPPVWRAGVRFVHEVWAPSRFAADALRPLLPGRVRVVPHPLAEAPPVPSALGRADFGLPARAIVVLVSFSLASSLARKNPEAAIAAFRAAFGADPAYLLLLKVSHSGQVPDDLRRLASLAAAANIRLETRILPEADSHALTRCADIVLSLHRSEGFGLVPAEAMLLGRAVVATDWSGTTDFLDASCGVPVRYTLVPARDPRGVFEAPGASWAEADVRDAAEALRGLAADAGRRAGLGAAAVSMATARLGAGPLLAALDGQPADLPG